MTLLLAIAVFADSPETVNRGRAAMRAGDLPQAIFEYRQGLRHAPADPDLRQDLQLARTFVLAPHPAMDDWHHRVTPKQLFQAFGLFTILASIAAALHLTSRPRGAGIITMIAGLGALSVVAAALELERRTQRERDTPFAVVRQAAPLREGNGASYPAVKDIPRGTEMTVLHHRGEWTLVELADGTRGWLPDDMILMSDYPAIALYGSPSFNVGRSGRPLYL